MAERYPIHHREGSEAPDNSDSGPQEAREPVRGLMPERLAIPHQNGTGAGATRDIAVDQSGPQTEPDQPQIALADQSVRELADAIIGRILVDLVDADILYAFERRDRKRRGRVQFGRAVILNALDRWLGSGRQTVESGPDVVVLISRSQWLAVTTPEVREARLARVLAGIGVETTDDGATRYTPRPPDAEVYLDVVREYGVGWDVDLQTTRQTLLQLELPLAVTT